MSPARAQRRDESTARLRPAGAAGLAEHVYQLLKAEVINDQFEAEQRIVIESVATRLGVSPTPVREALARLAGEQLVAFRAYVGYSALPPLSLAELRDLFEAREVIECAGAMRACERSTDADLASLREIDARIREGHYGKDRYSEFVSFVNDNQSFHETLLDAARNPELRRAFDALNYEARIARRTRGRGVPDLAPDLRGARRDHRRAGRARCAGPRRRRRRPRAREPPAPRRGSHPPGLRR